MHVSHHNRRIENRILIGSRVSIKADNAVGVRHDQIVIAVAIDISDGKGSSGALQSSEALVDIDVDRTNFNVLSVGRLQSVASEVKLRFIACAKVAMHPDVAGPIPKQN